MVRGGLECLGDDLILIDDRTVRAFPKHGTNFDYSLRSRMESESDLRGWRNAGMVAHLLRKPRPGFHAAEPSRPRALVVIHSTEGKSHPVSRALSLEESLAKTWTNTRMEWNPARPPKYRIGDFLDAYHLVFPDNPYADHWARGFGCLGKLLKDSGTETHLLETDTRWRAGNLPVMSRLLGLRG
jgi:hypothetical protein